VIRLNKLGYQITVSLNIIYYRSMVKSKAWLSKNEMQIYLYLLLRLISLNVFWTGVLRDMKTKITLK